jgi:hypothetical protein
MSIYHEESLGQSYRFVAQKKKKEEEKEEEEEED